MDVLTNASYEIDGLLAKALNTKEVQHISANAYLDPDFTPSDSLSLTNPINSLLIIPVPYINHTLCGLIVILNSTLGIQK